MAHLEPPPVPKSAVFGSLKWGSSHLAGRANGTACLYCLPLGDRIFFLDVTEAASKRAPDHMTSGQVFTLNPMRPL